MQRLFSSIFFSQEMTPSETIAASAAVIALFSFGLTIWQAYIARKHNRLSVMILPPYNRTQPVV